MTKKNISFLLIIIFCTICLNSALAQKKDISLPQPQTTGGLPLMEALSKRESLRSFSDKKLSPQTLSNLLWAGFGINRRHSGKRTAPSAGNRQEVDIYVATPEAVFVYNARHNKLETISNKDIRHLCGVQDFVKTAPIVLIYVADYRKMAGDQTQKDFYAAADTGYISQNVLVLRLRRISQCGYRNGKQRSSFRKA